MKTPNRVRRKGGKTPSPSQSQTSERPIALNSNKCAESIRILDAFALLKLAFSEVVVITMFNARHIKDNVNASDEWIALDTPTFMEGVLDAPRSVASSFKKNIEAWELYVTRIIEAWDNSKAVNEPCETLGFSAENEVGALIHLLKMQGEEITNRSNDFNAGECSEFFSEHLQCALDTTLDACRKFDDMVKASSSTPIPKAA